MKVIQVEKSEDLLSGILFRLVAPKSIRVHPLLPLQFGRAIGEAGSRFFDTRTTPESSGRSLNAKLCPVMFRTGQFTGGG